MLNSVNTRCALLLAFLVLLPCAGVAQERCGAGKDLMVRALERVSTNSSQSDIEDGIQLLKHATEECSTLGDAWYYRSLFERKLGRASQADYALKKAQFNGSEAMDQKLDPFHLAAPAEPGETLPRNVHDKWALVIGVSKFRDPSINLEFTAKDAQDFAALLTNKAYGRFQPDHVHLITDSAATTKRIKEELNWIARSAGRNDLIVIYLSSHGTPRQADIGGVNYIYTADTEVTDQDSLFATALPMVDVVDVVRTRVQARRAVVFLDTCHSGEAVGAGIKPSSVNAATLDRLTQGVGRVIIASSQADQESYESRSIRHGFFTYNLIRALKQDNGLDDIDKVYAFVRDQVSKQVMAEKHQPQTPVMSKGAQAAEIVIGVETGSRAALLIPSTR